MSTAHWSTHSDTRQNRFGGKACERETFHNNGVATSARHNTRKFVQVVTAIPKASNKNDEQRDKYAAIVKSCSQIIYKTTGQKNQ